MVKSNIILYDGVCNFCNSCMQYVRRYDKDGKFSLLPLQSKTGQELMKSIGKNGNDLSSVVYIRVYSIKPCEQLNENNLHDVEVFEKSDAAIHVIGVLFSVPQTIISIICTVLPKRLRDCVYDLVARNRYSIMGKRTDCGCDSKDSTQS